MSAAFYKITSTLSWGSACLTDFVGRRTISELAILDFSPSGYLEGAVLPGGGGMLYPDGGGG